MRCTHRGDVKREHLRLLATLRPKLGLESDPGASAQPLVLIHCGERLTRDTNEEATRACLGCEVVHVRLDTPDAADQTMLLTRAAVRFADEVGDLRGPRRGPLAHFDRPPIALAPALCPGLERCGICVESCSARAIAPGNDGRPRARPGACTFCGDCIIRCPTGALGFTHAPWRAIHARLEALLKGSAVQPVALVLWERPEPLSPAETRVTEQPRIPWILPMELPRGTLGVGILLRAIELGAGVVCAVVDRDDASCIARVLSAIEFARAIGRIGAITMAYSVNEATARVAERPPRPGSSGEETCEDPERRPDAAAIAFRLWRGAAAEAEPAPMQITDAGAFGGMVSVEKEACTLCGLCTAACPTGALTLRREKTVALSFDSRLCGSPCGHCASACIAKALTVSAELRLPPTQTTLVARAGTCAVCGQLWPEAANVAAFGPRLAAGGMVKALGSFLAMCPDCRLQNLSKSLSSVIAPENREPLSRR